MTYNGCMYGCSPYMSDMTQGNRSYHTDPLCGMLMGYAYVPYQQAGKLYCDSDALKYGTLFPELNITLEEYGKQFCNCKNNGKEQ